MSSIFGLYNAYRGMSVNMAALNVVNSNIVNMNTDGYSKQRTEISQVTVGSNSGGSAESLAATNAGSQIDAITRNRDVYLDKYFRNESSDLSFYKEMSGLSQLLEGIVNELDGTGLTNALNKFYEASQQLSQDPANSVLRTNFVQTSINVGVELNQSAGQLNDLRESLVGDPNVLTSIESSKIHLSCVDINNKLASIADLNKDIAYSTSQGGVPNSLLDQRDKLLDEISELIPINVQEGGNNLISVKLGNIELVQGFEQIGYFEAIINPSTVTAEVEANPAIVRINNSSGDPIVGNAKPYITSGKVGAILEIGGADLNDLTIKNVLTDLDNLAANFAAQVNAIQLYSAGGPPATESSMCIDNTVNPVQLKLATEAIFYDDADTMTNITASNIKVNQNIIDNPFEVATARGAVDNSTPPPVPVEPDAVGDNSNILLTAQIRNASITGLDGLTTEEFLTSFMGELGVKTENIMNNYETQNAVIDQIRMTRDSLTGVNLDEELIDLVKFQRGYEASARVFNVFNEILEKLVNLGA